MDVQQIQEQVLPVLLMLLKVYFAVLFSHHHVHILNVLFQSPINLKAKIPDFHDCHSLLLLYNFLHHLTDVLYYLENLHIYKNLQNYLHNFQDHS